LVAIDNFMMHVLPPYFQKSRHYGLHSPNTWKKQKDKICKKLLRNPDTVKNLFALINALIKQEAVVREKCEGKEFEIKPIRANVFGYSNTSLCLIYEDLQK